MLWKLICWSLELVSTSISRVRCPSDIIPELCRNSAALVLRSISIYCHMGGWICNDGSPWTTNSSGPDSDRELNQFNVKTHLIHLINLNLNQLYPIYIYTLYTHYFLINHSRNLFPYVPGFPVDVPSPSFVQSAEVQTGAHVAQSEARAAGGGVNCMTRSQRLSSHIHNHAYTYIQHIIIIYHM